MHERKRMVTIRTVKYEKARRAQTTAIIIGAVVIVVDVDIIIVVIVILINYVIIRKMNGT